MSDSKSPIEQLDEYHSWKLERLSPSTFPNDITLKLAPTFSDAEIKAVRDLLKKKTCYRCRIAKQRFYFGSSAAEAARLAVAGWKQRFKSMDAK